MPPVIDGRLDEPFWERAAWVPGDYVEGSVGKTDPVPCLRIRYAWDDGFLYIGYETFDTNLVAAGSGETQGPAGNRRDGALIWDATQRIDVVEFFIGFDDPHFIWELHHNALNQFNDVWCTVPGKDWPLARSSMTRHGLHFGFAEVLQDDGTNSLAMAVQLKPGPAGPVSTPNAPGDIDAGYTSELRIPWFGLGAPLARRRADKSGWNMAGLTVRVLAVVQDMDRPVRYHHSSPTKGGGWFHQAFADWPAYRLTTAEPAGPR